MCTDAVAWYFYITTSSSNTWRTEHVRKKRSLPEYCRYSLCNLTFSPSGKCVHEYVYIGRFIIGRGGAGLAGRVINGFPVVHKVKYALSQCY